MAARKTTDTEQVATKVRKVAPAPRQTPPIGIDNANRARENISLKLKFLESIVMRRVCPREQSTESYPLSDIEIPLSQRKFNAWESGGISRDALNEYGPFWKNSNSTLLKNDDLLKRLHDYYDLLKHTDASDRNLKKTESVASLHRRLSMEKALRRIAEKELARARVMLWRKQEEIESLKASIQSTSAKGREVIDQLSSQLQVATTARAEIASAMAKVVGIKRVLP